MRLYRLPLQQLPSALGGIKTSKSLWYHLNNLGSGGVRAVAKHIVPAGYTRRVRSRPHTPHLPLLFEKLLFILLA